MADPATIQTGPDARDAICSVCAFEMKWPHDHKPDNSGLDDGPDWPVRKKAAPKSPEVMAEIRARAWATRRMKYGECGNAKYGRRPHG